MKPIAIISLIALSSAGIGLFQQSRLAALKRESAELARDLPGSSTETPGRHPQLRPMDSNPAGGISSNESLANLEALLVGFFEKLVSAGNGQALTAAEQAEAVESRERLMKAFAALDPAGILELIQRLKSDPNLPDFFREKPAEACIELVMEVNPRALLDVIPSVKELPDPDSLMSAAFVSWLRASPVAALKWFDDESVKGNPLTAALLGTVIIAESRENPSHALSRALSWVAAGNPVSVVNLGGNISMTLDGENENLAFFAALRRESEKSPGSEVLAKIRGSYVDGLGDRLYEWPFESAVALIDAEFNPTEKAAMAKKLSNRGDLDEPGRWATWLLDAALPTDGKPPLRDFIVTWSHIDPVAAGKWLDQAPPGDLKNQLVKEHAAMIAEADEARAMQPALDRVNAEMRAKLAGQKAKNRESKEPPASTTVSKEHGPPE